MESMKLSRVGQAFLKIKKEKIESILSLGEMKRSCLCKTCYHNCLFPDPVAHPEK